MAPDSRSSIPARLSRLLSFLEQDPGNLNLLADTARAAIDAGEHDQARRLLDRYAASSPLTPTLQNLDGLVAIEEHRFEAAADIFERLLEQAPEAPTLLFNLAFSRMMLRDFSSVVDLIDEPVIAATPQAATLKIQALHQLGRLEDALALGIGCAARYPEDRALMSELAILALDAEEPELARDFATRAGGTHEGLSTLGMLALSADDVQESMMFFERALDVRSDSARALLGKGLVQMTCGELDAAAANIDRAAATFGRHLGSWVASGWAHLVKGDYQGARAAFEHAMELDPTFAETQGSLAVLDILESQTESARRRTDVALRLDRKCFSAALAKSLLLAADGEVQAAQRVQNIALNSAIGKDGRTLLTMVTRFSGARKSFRPGAGLEK